MFSSVNQVIVKVTKKCNLNCSYCYIDSKEKKSNTFMEFDTYKNMIDRIHQDRIKGNKKNKLEIVFHGGEPTLIGLEKIEDFICYTRQVIPEARFSIQTNLSLIDKNWVSLFFIYNISPGISLDGFKRKSNLLRKTADYEKKIELLTENNINCGILMILSEKNIKNFKTEFPTILKKTNSEMIKANYVENLEKDNFMYPEITGDTLFKYMFIPVMKYFFKHNKMVESNVHYMLTLFFSHWLNGFNELNTNTPLSNCHSRFCAGGHSVVMVDDKGDVSFCGRWKDKNSMNFLGNVSSPDIFELKSFSKIFNLAKIKADAIDQKGCDNCFARFICEYGCIAFAFGKYERMHIREEIVCSFTKKVFNFFMTNRFNLLYNYALSKKSIQKNTNNENYYLINIPQNYSSNNTAKINTMNIYWHDSNTIALNKNCLKRKINFECSYNN